MECGEGRKTVRSLLFVGVFDEEGKKFGEIALESLASHKTDGIAESFCANKAALVNGDPMVEDNAEDGIEFAMIVIKRLRYRESVDIEKIWRKPRE